jgi:hypothetical protein
VLISAVVTTLALVLPLTGRWPAAASSDAEPVIAAGRLVDAGGRPTSGEVELLAWPTGRPVTVGDTVDLVPVGRAQAGPTGEFAVRSAVTPELAALAGTNGGYLNLELRALHGPLSGEMHLARYLARGVAWSADPGEAATAITLALRRAAGGVEATATETPMFPSQGGCYGMKLMDSQIGETIIGELRTPPDTLGASFVYGKQADSDISVAARGGTGPWSLSGSHHIANASGAAVAQRAANGEHLVVRSRFIYDRYEYFCAGGRREKVVPREWFGDVMSEATPPRGCATAPEERLGRFGSNTWFDRDKERAAEWNGAATVFGVSLSARSGYSERVHAHWDFGTDSMHLLCGDDGPPARASHIFAGKSS